MVKKNQMGAPSKYKADYARQAGVACAEGGLTDVKLAKLFNVSKTTITTWKKEHPDFLASVKKGRDIWDSTRVEDSLLKRAMGYKYNEITKERVVKKPKDGPVEEKLIVTKIIRKEVVADTTAQIFWLTNRNRDRWKRNIEPEKQDTTSGLESLFNQISEALPD